MTEAARPQGYKAKKSLGQNFLVDRTVCPRIAEKADIDGRGVLEIGPGFGALTAELCRRASRVLAVEIDGDVIPQLKENLASFDNLTVVRGDAMEMDLGALIREHFGEEKVAVAGNLPYYITSPLILKLLEKQLPVRSLTVMVQKEAAVRFCAEPGTRECGAVSAAVWYRSVPRILFSVPPGAFRPVPKVDSCVMRLEIREKPPVEVPDEEFFFRVVRAAFGQRRKTAAKSIAALGGFERRDADAAVASAGLDPAVRAERMTLEQLAQVSRYLYAI